MLSCWKDSCGLLRSPNSHQRTYLLLSSSISLPPIIQLQITNVYQVGGYTVRGPTSTGVYHADGTLGVDALSDAGAKDLYKSLVFKEFDGPFTGVHWYIGFVDCEGLLDGEI